MGCWSSGTLPFATKSNSVFSLQFLGHDLSDGGCGLDLHGVGNVGVGTESEARIGVPQHAGNRADVHAALQRHCGERVPKLV